MIDIVCSTPLNTAPRACRACFYRLAAWCVGALAIALPSAGAWGAQIDVSLNLFYTDTADPTSGGTWTLSAKTDESGLLGLNVRLQGIASEPGDLTLMAPTGAVNGSESAGFFLVYSDKAAYTEIAIAQAPSRDGQGEERVFYGVGSINNPQGGAPNYPGQPEGTLSIGPELTTLSNVQRGVWGTGDELGDPAWDQAAVLLSGIFLPGSSPSFFASGGPTNNGTVFLTTGTLTTAGSNSNPASTTVTTIVRSNLAEVDFQGDYNGDGIVDAADYTIWRNTFGATVEPYSGADGSGNGVIDSDDYLVWKNFFGQSAPAAGGLESPISAVPEPSTAIFALFCAGFATTALRRKAKTKVRETTDQKRIFEKMLYSGETA